MKDLINKIHEQNVQAGWWTDLVTGESLTSKTVKLHGKQLLLRRTSKSYQKAKKLLQMTSMQ